MSIFKDTLRKVPWWAWVLLPVALLILLFSLFGKGIGLPWKTPSDPVARPGPPAITPKQAEEKREEIAKNLEEEESKITTEADELRKKIADKFGPRPE